MEFLKLESPVESRKQCGDEMLPSENPRNWKYTWEAQSQLPILKLFLFSETFNPSLQCKDLQVELKFETSKLLVSWIEEKACVSLAIPVPKVLLEIESPINFRALDDHIEVKVALLLPIDHPIVSGFVSDLYNEAGNGVENPPSTCFWSPLTLDSDAGLFATNGESHFYCRKCSFKLTQEPIRSFVELPSADWREVADNWFGSCCCSFGGISEKVVARYAKSHACREGSCLMSTTSVILHEDDVVGFNASDNHCIRSHDEVIISETTLDGGNCHALSSLITSEDVAHDSKCNLSSVEMHRTRAAFCEEDTEQKEYLAEEKTSIQSSAPDVLSDNKCCSLSSCHSSSKDQEIIMVGDLSMYQKLLLNGYLGNVFMFKSSDLSKDIEWVKYECPECSSLLGAYPSTNGDKSIDGGIRLLKCCISTSSTGSSHDLFSKYTLERMFSAKLMESADDELSFRTSVKELKSKALRLEMVLLNPDSWHYTGSCEEGSVDLAPMIFLHPVIKVLFSGSNDPGSSLRHSPRKDQMDDMFMLDVPIEQVKRSLELSSHTFPPSLTSLQGFSLSILPR